MTPPSPPPPSPLFQSHKRPPSKRSRPGEGHLTRKWDPGIFGVTFFLCSSDCVPLPPFVASYPEHFSDQKIKSFFLFSIFYIGRPSACSFPIKILFENLIGALCFFFATLPLALPFSRRNNQITNCSTHLRSPENGGKNAKKYRSRRFRPKKWMRTNEVREEKKVKPKRKKGETEGQ